MEQPTTPPPSTTPEPPAPQPAPALTAPPPPPAPPTTPARTPRPYGQYDGSRPLKSSRADQFCRLRANRPELTAAAAYALAYGHGMYTQCTPNVQTFCRNNAARLGAVENVHVRISHLLDRIAEKSVMSAVQRRAMLAEFAREVLTTDAGSVITPDGSGFDVEKIKTNGRRINKIKVQRGRDGKALGISEVGFRPATDGIAAIQELNKMERIYSEPVAGINVELRQIVLGMGEASQQPGGRFSPTLEADAEELG